MRTAATGTAGADSAASSDGTDPHRRAGRRADPAVTGRRGDATRSGVATWLRGMAFLLVAIAGLALTDRSLAQEIKYELVSFGVANAARPGDGVGVRIAVVSTATEVKTVEVVWIVPNADGDPIECSRIVNVSPGGRVERWLYARLPPNSTASSVVTQAPYSVRLYEVDAQHNRIADLYSQPMSGADAQTASLPVDQLADMSMVIGDSRLGLEGYASGGGMSASATPPSMNSMMVTIDGRTPRDICDDWKGLSAFSTILWCDGRHRPRELETSQAKALLEWVRRGHTLVIGVASDLAAEAWDIGKPDSHRLSEILPSVAPTRHEGVPLTVLQEILSKSPINDLKATTRVYTFDPKSLDRGYRPIVAIPARKDPVTGYVVKGVPGPNAELAGAVVGIQRNYGLGQIVILGVDVDGINQRALPGGPYPNADVFWNPILGRRGDTITPGERSLLENDQKILGVQFSSTLGSGGTVSEYIGMQPKAASAAFAALVLFIFYWLISGPVGFVALKQVKRQRLSWMLFVVAAFLFTALAWAGGVVLGQTTPSIRHLTVIDQLAVDPAETSATAGVPPMRATCYFSAFLPNYNEHMIAVGGDGDGNTLDSWSRPPSGSGDTYPNKLQYILPSEPDQPRGISPSGYRVPARATTADFVAQWMGAVSTDWGQIVQMKSPVELRPIREGNGIQFQLVGTLVHGLPGALEQVRVIVVTPRRRPLPVIPLNAKWPMPMPDRSGQMPLHGYFFSLTGSWQPNQPLDLDGLVTKSDGEKAGPAAQLPGQLPPVGSGSYELSVNIEKAYRDPIRSQFTQFTGDTLGENDRRRYLESLTLYGMLSPPEWLNRGAGTQSESARAEREHCRELDLSHWFTRPCIIVTGFLEERPTPVPLLIDGASVVSDGTTMYRWILPLDGYGAEKDAPYQGMAVPEPRADLDAAAVPTPPTPPATPGEPAAAPAETPNTPPLPRPRPVPAPGRR